MYRIENYRSFAIGIIEGAVRDFKEYTHVFYTTKQSKKKQECLEEIDKIHVFIRSSWFQSLNEFSKLNINPDELIQKLSDYFDNYKPPKKKENRK